MDLFENPFYLLEVTTRDQSQKIVLAAEEKSLLLDPDVCTKARTTLINPKQRLSAEVSWLPGLAPGKAIELMQKISTSPNEVTNTLSMLPPLVQCNLSTSLIERLSFKDNTAHLEKWILYIANSYENIDAGGLLALLNEDRTVARFPSIPKKEDVEQELNSHKNYLVEVLKNALNSIPDPDVLLTDVLEQAMQNGAPVPLLLDDLTELYRIEVQKYLDQLADEIDQMISSLQNDLTDANGVLATLYKRISRLEETLKTWAQIAKPLNLVMQNRGLQDEHSIHLADQIRGLAIFLANEHGLYAEARLITCLMAEVFEKLPQVFEKINEDIRELDKILLEKEKAEKEAEEWKREVSLDIEIGRIFKKRLIITPERISYTGVSLPLEKITYVRWGILVHYGNGIKYDVWIGTPDIGINIECSQSFESEEASRQRYELILEKLRKAVCVRLIGETLNKLSQGEKLTYGEITADKNGILLKKIRFSGSEPYYARWEDLSIGNGPGVFIITATKDKEVQANLSYREINNVHILEAVMRYLWKDGHYLKLQQGMFS